MTITKTKTYEFELDIPRFIEEYGITAETDDDQIKFCLERHMSGYDDDIYYSFPVDEVYKEYIDAIRKAAKDHKIDLVGAFAEIIRHKAMGHRLTEASTQIRKILIDHAKEEDKEGSSPVDEFLKLCGLLEMSLYDLDSRPLEVKLQDPSINVMYHGINLTQIYRALKNK